MNTRPVRTDKDKLFYKIIFNKRIFNSYDIHGNFQGSVTGIFVLLKFFVLGQKISENLCPTQIKLVLPHIGQKFSGKFLKIFVLG